jgi:hypothetical protein
VVRRGPALVAPARPRGGVEARGAHAAGGCWAGCCHAMEQRGQQLESCTLSYGSALRTEFLLIFLKYAKQELNSHSQYAAIRNIFCWRLNT